MRSTKRILSIKFLRLEDTDADLSYLGEYSNTRTSPESIDREARGDRGRNEYRYFNPSFNYTSETPAERAKYTEQDYERMEAYNRGAWCCYGVQAVADVLVSAGGSIQRITSCGLWGIESDSEPSCFAEVEADELADLTVALVGLGFTKRQVARVTPEPAR